MNKAILKGRAGREPEMRYTPAGKAVCTLSLATDRRWTAGDGTKKKETDWHNLEFWGKQAEIVNEYIKKGSELLVEGRIAYEQYEKDGQKKYFTKIVVSEMEFCGGRQASEEAETVEEGVTF